MAYDLGSVPEWLGALGTIGAFAIAIGIYWREVQEGRKSQAILISAWWSRVDPQGKDIGTFGDAQPREDVGFRLWIKNSSQEAVYGCYLIAEAQPSQEGDDGNASVDLGRFASFSDGQIVVAAGIVPPAEALRYFIDGTQIRSLGAVTIVFRDAAGRAWRRSGGVLERDDSPATP
jgi:hypothetical protein